MKNNIYSDMQRRIYNRHAADWGPEGDAKNEIVGPFDAHNNWEDYEFLFCDTSNLKDKVCLDFGCGPGRNLVKYHDRFKRIDGVDISYVALEKAKIWIVFNNLNLNDFTLYNSTGFDIAIVPNELYDMVMSTICLQHICVHQIRLNLFREFFRVLKSGGIFTAQMGYGSPSPKTVPYATDFYEAEGTNRAMDTAIEHPDQLKNDLESCGFTNFNYYIRPVGCGDFHPNWIYFNAKKM